MLGKLAHNVLAVCDVFAVAIKEREAFLYRNRKNVAEQKCTKGASPTAFLCSPSRRQAAKRIQTCYTMIFLPLTFKRRCTWTYNGVK